MVIALCVQLFEPLIDGPINVHIHIGRICGIVTVCTAHTHTMPCHGTYSMNVMMMMVCDGNDNLIAKKSRFHSANKQGMNE